MGEGGNNKENKSLQDAQLWLKPALMMFARLTGWIVVPIIIGALVGQWLEKKYGNDPWLFLISVGVAFIFSMLGLIKNTFDEFKRVSKITDDMKKNKK